MKRFTAEPARVERGWAKRMRQDPPPNFAILPGSRIPGIDHRCHARSEKHRITDPQGVAWEHVHTLASIPVYNERAPEAARAACGVAAATPRSASACC